MAMNAGRAPTDPILSKSLGIFPYSNVFAITGELETSSNNFVLFSPSTDLQPLPRPKITTPQKVWVASTSANDSGASTGAQIIVVTGLDANYQIQEELVIMNGQTPVETQLTYCDVFEMSIFQVGTNTDSNTGDSMSVGDIYIARTSGEFTAGKPTNPLTCILAAKNNLNSREGLFTVPDGKILLVKSIFAGVTPTRTAELSLNLQLAFQLFNCPDNCWYKTPELIFDGTMQYKPEYNLPIPPKTKLQIRGKVIGNGTKKAFCEVNTELYDLR